MQIQFNTDNHIVGRETLAEHVESVVLKALSRFGGQVTRVEVHLSDESAGKNGPADKRCVIEARLEGRPPTAVSHHAESVDEALSGAAAKLQRALDSVLGKLRA